MGSKRVGLSISDENRKIATPLKTINYQNIQILVDELEKIIAELKTKDALIENEMRTIMSDHGGFAEVLKQINAAGLLPSGEKRSYGNYE